MLNSVWAVVLIVVATTTSLSFAEETWVDPWIECKKSRSSCTFGQLPDPTSGCACKCADLCGSARPEPLTADDGWQTVEQIDGTCSCECVRSDSECPGNLSIDPDTCECECPETWHLNPSCGENEVAFEDGCSCVPKRGPLDIDGMIQHFEVVQLATCVPDHSWVDMRAVENCFDIPHAPRYHIELQADETFLSFEIELDTSFLRRSHYNYVVDSSSGSPTMHRVSPKNVHYSGWLTGEDQTSRVTLSMSPDEECLFSAHILDERRDRHYKIDNLHRLHISPFAADLAAAQNASMTLHRESRDVFPVSTQYTTTGPMDVDDYHETFIDVLNTTDFGTDRKRINGQSWRGRPVRGTAPLPIRVLVQIDGGIIDDYFESADDALSVMEETLHFVSTLFERDFDMRIVHEIWVYADSNLPWVDPEFGQFPNTFPTNVPHEYINAARDDASSFVDYRRAGFDMVVSAVHDIESACDSDSVNGCAFTRRQFMRRDEEAATSLCSSKNLFRYARSRSDSVNVSPPRTMAHELIHMFSLTHDPIGPRVRQNGAYVFVPELFDQCPAHKAGTDFTDSWGVATDDLWEDQQEAGSIMMPSSSSSEFPSTCIKQTMGVIRNLECNKAHYARQYVAENDEGCLGCAFGEVCHGGVCSCMGSCHKRDQRYPEAGCTLPLTLENYPHMFVATNPFDCRCDTCWVGEFCDIPTCNRGEPHNVCIPIPHQDNNSGQRGWNHNSAHCTCDQCFRSSEAGACTLDLLSLPNGHFAPVPLVADDPDTYGISGCPCAPCWAGIFCDEPLCPSARHMCSESGDSCDCHPCFTGADCDIGINVFMDNDSHVNYNVTDKCECEECYSLESGCKELISTTCAPGPTPESTPHPSVCSVECDSGAFERCDPSIDACVCMYGLERDGSDDCRPCPSPCEQFTEGVCNTDHLPTNGHYMASEDNSECICEPCYVDAPQCATLYDQCDEGEVCDVQRSSWPTFHCGPAEGSQEPQGQCQPPDPERRRTLTTEPPSIGANMTARVTGCDCNCGGCSAKGGVSGYDVCETSLDWDLSLGDANSLSTGSTGANRTRANLFVETAWNECSLSGKSWAMSGPVTPIMFEQLTHDSFVEHVGVLSWGGAEWQSILNESESTSAGALVIKLSVDDEASIDFSFSLAEGIDAATVRAFIVRMGAWENDELDTTPYSVAVWNEYLQEFQLVGATEGSDTGAGWRQYEWPVADMYDGRHWLVDSDPLDDSPGPWSFVVRVASDGSGTAVSPRNLQVDFLTVFAVVGSSRVPAVDARPVAPDALAPKVLSPTTTTLQWTHSMGMVNRFEIELRESGSGDDAWHIVATSLLESVEVLLRELTPDTDYDARVCAMSWADRGGCAETSFSTHSTPTPKPTSPSPVPWSTPKPTTAPPTPSYTSKPTPNTLTTPAPYTPKPSPAGPLSEIHIGSPSLAVRSDGTLVACGFDVCAALVGTSTPITGVPDVESDFVVTHDGVALLHIESGSGHLHACGGVNICKSNLVLTATTTVGMQLLFDEGVDMGVSHNGNAHVFVRDANRVSVCGGVDLCYVVEKYWA